MRILGGLSNVALFYVNWLNHANFVAKGLSKLLYLCLVNKLYPYFKSIDIEIPVRNLDEIYFKNFYLG